jgi:hypothetical protein
MPHSLVMSFGCGQARRSTPRSSDRRPLSIEVGIRLGGGHCFRVRLFDLSPKGCKIEFVERPDLGERVCVKFDTLQGIAGSVRWVAGHVGGVQFEPPIHSAVFDALVGRAADQAMDPSGLALSK